MQEFKWNSISAQINRFIIINKIRNVDVDVKKVQKYIILLSERQRH